MWPLNAANNAVELGELPEDPITGTKPPRGDFGSVPGCRARICARVRHTARGSCVPLGERRKTSVSSHCKHRSQVMSQAGTDGLADGRGACGRLLTLTPLRHAKLFRERWAALKDVDARQ